MSAPPYDAASPRPPGLYPTPYNTPYVPAPAPGYAGAPPGYAPVPGYPPASPGGYPPPPGGYPQPPVTTQPMMPPQGPPGAGGWMSIPQGIPNCPPGLEYLTRLDQLLVQQKKNMAEILVGAEMNNRYTVKNSLGHDVYHAQTYSDCLARYCCGPMQPFQMKINDANGAQVIELNRPLACDSCCFPCCLQSLEVCSPPGTIIGIVEQEWSLFCPSFSIKNAQEDTVLKIEGPCCTFSICGDVEFKIMSLDGSTQVGRISKQWSGLMNEMFTDADFFGITFPMDLDVRMKAVMLGACFLIDAMFFEKKQT